MMIRTKKEISRAHRLAKTQNFKLEIENFKRKLSDKSAVDAYL
jgi:hypothetical protein